MQVQTGADPILASLTTQTRKLFAFIFIMTNPEK